MRAQLGFFCFSLCWMTTVALFGQNLSTQSAAPAPFEISSFKIGTDTYPMLDSKPSMMTADNPDFPRPPGEVAMRQNRRGGLGERNEEIKSRGKSRTVVRLLDEAEWVKFTIKNMSAQTIKTIAWDFAFPRYSETRQLLLRQSVVSQEEIKPGGKRTLKYPLPPGATRCKVVNVVAAKEEGKTAKTQESVCGRGFNDPTKLNQETVFVQRIEYADGSIWQK